MEESVAVEILIDSTSNTSTPPTQHETNPQSIDNDENNEKMDDGKTEDSKTTEVPTEEVEDDAQSDLDEHHQDLINEGLSNLGYPASGVGQVFLNLTLSCKNLEDVEFVSKFEHLQVLDVSHNFLTDLSMLKNLQHLISLNASYNQLTDVIAFNPPFHIREMNYSNNNISKIGDLSCHASLNTLLLDYNNIEEIAGIDECRSLRSLSLAQNKITRISGIDGLLLKQLDLSNNEIKKIENMQNLKFIQHIDLSNNIIRSLRGLQEHNFLEDINLENNQVLDFSEVRYLRDLRLLRILNLSYNPIQETIDYRSSTLFKLPMLVELDSVPVLAEEKVAANNLFRPTMEVLASRDHVYNVMRYFQQPQVLLDSTLTNYEPYPMLVIVGPIGMGKKALAQKLCQEFPSYFGYCASYTTDEPSARDSTSDSPHDMEDGKVVDYHYVTVEKFEDMKNQGAFLQTITKYGYNYGITHHSIEEVAQTGRACVLTMELQGILSLKQTHYEPRLLLMVPKDTKVYSQSLREKNSQYSESQIEESLSDNDMHVETHRTKPGFFDATIVTDNFDERYNEMRKTILEYLGLTSSVTCVDSSISMPSKPNSRYRAISSSRRHLSLCPLFNDSSISIPDRRLSLPDRGFSVPDKGSCSRHRTAVEISYERRYEDTRSALINMSSSLYDQSNVLSTFTPNVIPYATDFQDVTELLTEPNQSMSFTGTVMSDAGNVTSRLFDEVSEISVLTKSDLI